MKRDYVLVGEMAYGDALVANLRFALLDQKRARAMRDAHNRPAAD